MVGRLSLREVPDLPDMRKRGDAGLDSPDSGLPPSPGPVPPSWLLSSGGSPDRTATNGLPEPDTPAPAAAVSTGTGRVPVSCPPPPTGLRLPLLPAAPVSGCCEGARRGSGESVGSGEPAVLLKSLRFWGRVSPMQGKPLSPLPQVGVGMVSQHFVFENPCGKRTLVIPESDPGWEVCILTCGFR